MRKPAIFIAILLALGLLLPCASAADHAPPLLRVGYTNVPGYISKGEDGYFRGFLYDYLEAIAIYGGYRFEYIEAQPTQCVEKLRRGELDLIAALPDEENTFPDLATMQHAITYSPIGVTSRPEKTLAPGQGLRIGYTSFICSEQDILSALQSYGLHEGDDFVLKKNKKGEVVILLDEYHNCSLFHRMDGHSRTGPLC